MDALLTKAISEGLGYALFVCLLMWVMKKQEERDKKSEAREEKHLNIIDKLSLKIDVKLDKIEELLKK